MAEEAGALLVTTAKDAVRVPQALRPRLFILTVTLIWEDESALTKILSKVSIR